MGSYCQMDIAFQFHNMKKSMEMDGSDSCTTLWMYLTPLNCTLIKMVNFAMCILQQLKNSKITPIEHIIYIPPKLFLQQNKACKIT